MRGVDVVRQERACLRATQAGWACGAVSTGPRRARSAARARSSPPAQPFPPASVAETPGLGPHAGAQLAPRLLQLRLSLEGTDGVRCGLHAPPGALPLLVPPSRLQARCAGRLKSDGHLPLGKLLVAEGEDMETTRGPKVYGANRSSGLVSRSGRTMGSNGSINQVVQTKNGIGQGDPARWWCSAPGAGSRSKWEGEGRDTDTRPLYTHMHARACVCVCVCVSLSV